MFGEVVLKKFFTSAIVLIPPQQLWPPIQEIRKNYDRAYFRWMPHINIMYPFVHNDMFSRVLSTLSQIVSNIQPFTIRLERFNYFQHKNSCTMWLEPTPNTEIVKLHNLLVNVFPDFNDLDTLNDRGFTPHLSVGQQKNEATVLEKITEFQRNWQSLEWEVNEMHLISRVGDQPFEIRYTIPFGGGVPIPRSVLEPQPHPYLTKDHQVFIGNLPFNTTEDVIKTLLTDKGLNVLEITIVRHRISGKSKGFGFVVFNSEEDKQKALQWNEKIILKDRPLWIRSPKNEDLNRESQEKNTNN